MLFTSEKSDAIELKMNYPVDIFFRIPAPRQKNQGPFIVPWKEAFTISIHPKLMALLNQLRPLVTAQDRQKGHPGFSSFYLL